jgi:hypothetical protein
MSSSLENIKTIESKLIFNSNEECKKNLNNWKTKDKIKTNPKFETFDQQIYYGGDFNDINRFGLNKAFDFHLNIKNSNGLPNKSINYKDIERTFLYIFNKFKKGVYVQIKDNKISTYFPFSNYYYFNDWFEHLSIKNNKKDLELMIKLHNLFIKLTNDSIFWKLDDLNEFENLRLEAINNFSEYKKNNPDVKYLNVDRLRWTGNNCIFQANFPITEGSHSIDIYFDILNTLTKERKVPDCHFFLNLRDFPINSKKCVEPYTSIFGKNVKMNSDFKRVSKVSIMSYTSHKKYNDIPIITYEDWLLYSTKYYPSKDCILSDSVDQKIYNKDWDSKKEIAIFRGTPTGCNVTDKDNVRLISLKLSKKYPDLIDSKITQWGNLRLRFNNNQGAGTRSLRSQKSERSEVAKGDSGNNNGNLNLIKMNKEYEKKYGVSKFMSFAEFSNYKYILHLDGHAGAVRLGKTMGLHSLLLIPDTDFTIWIQEYLLPWVHYIPIKKNLSDLVEKIRWCKMNDYKCKKISEECNKIYNKHMSRDGLLNHMQKVLTDKINRNYIKEKKYKLKTKPLIIIPFRDNIKLNTQEEGSVTRTQQKEYLLEYFNKIFVKPPKIVFIIQSEDGGFNRGQLLNIGVDYYCNKKKGKFTHFIFHDVDLIPDYNLIKYYDIIPNENQPLMLSIRGTRYSRHVFNEVYSHYNNIKIVEKRHLKNKGVVNNKIKLFTGGVFSINPKTFLLSNGYPNGIPQWGVEDTLLGIRINRTGVDTYTVPGEGSLIDLENETNLSIDDKLKILRNKNLRFDKGWEYTYNDEKNWQNDGVKNLEYKVLNSKKNEIIVKIKQYSSDNINKLPENILQRFYSEITKPREFIKFNII